MDLPMKKSQQSKKGKTYVLDLGKNRNAKIRIDSLGDVELKYVSYGDTIEFAKMLEEKISDRDFVAKILAHQIIKPEADFKKVKKLPEADLEKLAKAFVKAENYTFKHFKDTGNYYKDFRQALKTSHEKQVEELRKTFEPIVKSAQETLTAFSKNYASAIQQTLDRTSYIQESLKSVTEVAKRLSDTLKPAFDQINQTFKWLDALDKAGLTPNLGDDRSHRKLKQYLRLLKCGYAIFWIPRSEIIEKLLSANNESGRKAAILTNKENIIKDCEGVLGKIQNRELRDTKSHLESSITAFREGNYRASQSTASVCFDAQLDQIIDISGLTHYNQVRPSVSNKTKQLIKSYDNVPVQLIFAALQAHLIAAISKGFDRTKPKSVRLKYDRDSSIHSVSARQYNEFNALLAIMAATSLLTTTARLGKGWLSNL